MLIQFGYPLAPSSPADWGAIGRPTVPVGAFSSVQDFLTRLSYSRLIGLTNEPSDLSR